MDCFGGGEQVGGPPCPWSPADAVYRTGNRYGRNYFTDSVAYGRCDAGDAGFAFPGTLRPSAATNFGQSPFPEFCIRQ